jgi:hypothetical protein
VNFKDIPSKHRRIVVANLLKQEGESSVCEYLSRRSAQGIVDSVSWMRSAQGFNHFMEIYNESGADKRLRDIMYDGHAHQLLYRHA